MEPMVDPRTVERDPVLRKVPSWETPSDATKGRACRWSIHAPTGGSSVLASIRLKLQGELNDSPV